MKAHPRDLTLMLYADDPSAVKAPAAVEAHLRECARCSTTVEDYRLVTAAQREQETWWAAKEVAEQPVVRKIAEFEALMKAEDEDAKALLTPLLKSVYAFSLFTFTGKKRYYTGGVVRLLCAAARDQCDRQPRFAVTLAETATAIADALPQDRYPARTVFEVRGTAWKDYSTALRYVGRFDDCWKALDRAEEAYRQLAGAGSAGTALASVSLGRASILYKREHYAEALPYARRAAFDFAEFHDQARYFDAKQVEATILRVMGDPASAAAAYEAMRIQAEATGNEEMKARATQNLGVVALERGDLVSAASYFETTLKIVERLRLTARAARTRWSIGAVALAAGRFEEAARKLTASRSELLSLSMASTAQLAALDLAEALVMLRRWKEVHTLCTELVAFFRNADMINGALTAASFLKEAAAARKLTREQIGHVRRYLDALDRTPSLIFVRPNE